MRKTIKKTTTKPEAGIKEVAKTRRNNTIPASPPPPAERLMPPRGISDGPVGIGRAGIDLIELYATQNGVKDSLTVSDYNAWRILGLLSVFLGVRLPEKYMKGIKLTEPGRESDFEVRMGFDLPENPQLGDFLAAHLSADLMKKELAKKGFVMTEVTDEPPRDFSKLAAAASEHIKDMLGTSKDEDKDE